MRVLSLPKILFAGSLIFFHLTCHASENLPAYKFRHLTEIDGLSSKWVKCIYRDRLGYLWIGTADGLNRFDGINIRTYKFSVTDSSSINHNFVSAIFEDRHGNLWIGTQVGLNKYIRNKDCFHRIKGLTNYVSSFLELGTGILYIGSPGGLFVMDPHTQRIWQVNNEVGIESMVKSGNHRIWAGTRDGLFLIDDNFNFQKIALPLPEVRIRTLYVDSMHQLWVGTENTGLLVITNPNEKLKNFNVKSFRHNRKNPFSIRDGTVYAITQDPNKNFWIGIENGGVNILRANELMTNFPKFEHLEHNPFDSYTLCNNSVHAIYCDNQQTIWVGTYGNGLSYTNPMLQKFDHYRQVPGATMSLNNNFINALYDNEDYTFVGTEGGLNVWDKQLKKMWYFTSKPDDSRTISSNVVWSIGVDSRNNVWVGTWNGGLNRWDTKRKIFERIKFFHTDSTGMAGNSVTRIMESSDGLLWIATLGRGLFCYDYRTNTFTRYRFQREQNSLSCDWIFDIAEDKHGNIWIASTEAVDVFDRKKNHFRKYTYHPGNSGSISYNGALVLFRDSRDHMWIGTSNGLNVYDERSDGFRYYIEKDGLPNNSIKAICEDNRGNLWISTNRGISKFVGGSRLPSNPVFVNYTVSDGLQAYEFNARVAFKNSQGYLFFGGPNGYNVFHPDSMPENTFLPPVVFTNLYVFNSLVRPGDKTGILSENISYVKEIRLKKRWAVFTIEFAALNLIAPEKNQYAYYLEGIDRTWNYVGNKHSATYTYLPAGKYVLHVMASNNDGRWNKTGNSLKIIIVPAWWESLPAKVFYGLLFLLALYFFRKYTLISVSLKNQLWLEHREKQQMEELGRLKLQFFTNISHELRTPLTLILGPLKRLMDEGKMDEPLHTVYRNAFRLKTLVDQILDFSKLENEKMTIQLEDKDIVEIIRSALWNFADLSKQKGIQLHFNANATSCICKVDEDKIEKIITNLLSNALKNTPGGGEVKVGVQVEQSRIVMFVSDTGQGISADEIKHIFERFFTSSNTMLTKGGTGIGLNLTHKLVELLGGTIEVDSRWGKGTTFTVQLPLNHISYVDMTPVNAKVQPDIPVTQKTAEKLPRMTNRPTVMVVDDDEEMRDYLVSLLMQDYCVISESNPGKALEQLSNHMPDIVISDVMMTGMDGFEFCAKIKNDIRFCHIPVILLTAKTTIPDQIHGYETGADDYIVKPFDEKLLLSRIENLLEKMERIRRQLLLDNGEINRNTEIRSLDYAFMEKIMEVIHQNYMNADFNVNHIIEQMGMSRSVFYAKLRSLSAQSVNELITNYRLKMSVELLMNTHLSIREIAVECGFNDPAYFSRVFKQCFELSPKDYRALHSKNNNPATG